MKRPILTCTVILLIAIIAFITINYKWLFASSPPSASTPATPAEPAKKRIVFFHYWDKDFEKLKKALEQQEAKFNRITPLTQLHVSSLTHEAYKQNMNAMMEDSTHPELFSYWAGARTRALVDSGELSPIDQLWRTNQLDKLFHPFVTEQAATYHGNKYLVPLIQCYIFFFYNKKLFRELNLKEPATWQEFLATCQTLKEAGKVPIALGTRHRWPAQFWFDYLLLRTAGNDYRHKLMRGQARYTDPQVQAAFVKWQELLNKGYFNDKPNAHEWTESAKMVFDSNAGMVLMGTWIVDSFSKWGWQEEKDFGFFPFPAIANADNTLLTVIDGMVLSRSKYNQDEANEAMLYFTQKDVQEALSTASGNFAPSNAVPAGFYSPMKQRILNQVPTSLAFPYDLATPPAVERIGLAGFSQFLDFPQHYQTILKQADEKIQPLFKKK